MNDTQGESDAEVALVTYYSVKMLLTVDVNFMIESIMESLQPGEIRLLAMSDAEIQQATELVGAIRTIRERVHVYANSLSEENRCRSLERNIEQASP